MGHPKVASDVYTKPNDAIGTMSVNNAMLGVLLDFGIMNVGVYYSVAARTRTNISACGVTVILRIFCDL
jgi:hypothetical protein